MLSKLKMVEPFMMVEVLRRIIKIEKAKRTEVTKALYKSDAIFNYASSYYFNNESIAKPDKYIFSDSDYQEFLNFVKQNKTNFKTLSEKKFKLAFKTAKK